MNSFTRLAFQGECSLAMLDPQLIKPSAWSQPDECEFSNDRFQHLKNLISGCAGNLQPVKIRPTPHITLVLYAEADAEPDGFELVFGYARHRACLELGLPVLAMIERLSEVDALRQFVFEYRGHARWRPWRLGRTLNCALRAGLFRSLRIAAQELSMSVGETSLLAEIGRLPNSVRLAYGNLDLSPLQARKLVKAYAASPHIVELNSKKRQFRNCGTAPAVLATLTQEVE